MRLTNHFLQVLESNKHDYDNELDANQVGFITWINRLRLEGRKAIRKLAREIIDLRRELKEEVDRNRLLLKDIRIAEGNRDAVLLQVERLRNLDPNWILKEMESLLNQISGAGVSGGGRAGVAVNGRLGGAYVGVRISRVQVEEIKRRIGMASGKPDKRYMPYDLLLGKFVDMEVALEAALQDLNGDQSAKTVFDLRRLLSLGPDDDVTLAVERLITDASSVLDIDRLESVGGDMETDMHLPAKGRGNPH